MTIAVRYVENLDSWKPSVGSYAHWKNGKYEYGTKIFFTDPDPQKSWHEEWLDDDCDEGDCE